MTEDLEKREFARHEIEDFVKSRMWRAIVATMVSRTSGLMEDNNRLDPFKEPSQICRNQGIIAGIGEIIDLPAVMLEQTEFDKAKEKEEKEDGT